METRWNFPNNGFGQIRGVSDAGIETFSGKELKSLARETIQNSLDAVLDENQPVKVTFHRDFINSKDIPGYEDYKEAIHKGNDYWYLNGGEKAKAFYKEAVTSIDDSRTAVLVISDYNTTGLSDPYGDSFGGWNSLVRLDGGANKSEDSSGSFGIGKNAPFANSFYRLVFYRTVNSQNETAAQGIARVLSFPENSQNPMATMTTGIGYYGNPANNLPVPSISQLDKLNQRQGKGTDVFVYGFKYGKGTEWEKDIIKEVLENFLVSIFQGKLIVQVQDNREINKDSLSSYTNNYVASAKNAYSYYQVLTKTNHPDYHEIKEPFHDMGTLSLKVLVDPAQNFNRKVLVVRKAGMMLSSFSRISSEISFSGVLEIQGYQLNKFFRELETPSHDKWEPNRAKMVTPKVAKEYLTELKTWVINKILNLRTFNSDDEVNVKGLGEIFDEDLSLNEDGDNKNEGLNNHLGMVKIIPPKKQTAARGKLYSGSEKSKTKQVEGEVNEKGDSPAVRTLKGTRKRRKKQEHKGTPIEGGSDFVLKKENYGTNLPPTDIKNLKVISMGKGEYSINFTLPRNVSKARLEITTIGENGKSNHLNVRYAEPINNCQLIKLENGNPYVSGIKADQRAKLLIRLPDTRRYAMEINIYEYNE